MFSLREQKVALDVRKKDAESTPRGGGAAGTRPKQEDTRRDIKEKNPNPMAKERPHVKKEKKKRRPNQSLFRYQRKRAAHRRPDTGRDLTKQLKREKDLAARGKEVLSYDFDVIETPKKRAAGASGRM